MAATRRSTNQVRISAGLWKSRLITFPDAIGLRPTGDRIRQAAFNWLGQHLHGKVCLDAFSGSGALGFEAASRGAAQVVMCESNVYAAKFLLENKHRLGADVCEIVAEDVINWLGRQSAQFDVIFCDPPFDAALHGPFLAAISGHVSADTQIYCEAAQPLEDILAANDGFHITKSARAGRVYFGLLRPVLTG